MCRADNFNTFMCRLSWNMGASTSWNPQGLPRSVMGLLYLFTELDVYAVSTQGKLSLIFFLHGGSTRAEIPSWILLLICQYKWHYIPEEWIVHIPVLIRIKFYSVTEWTVQESNLGGGRFSATVQTGHGAHPASYTMGTGSFPGIKRPGPSVDHPTHLWTVAATSTVNFYLLNSIALTKNHVETFRQYWPATNTKNFLSIDYSLRVSKYKFLPFSQPLPVQFVSYIQTKTTN